MRRLAPGKLALAQAGDQAAIAALLAAVQPDIRRYARRSCRTTSDIEDAVQETLFILYRHLAALRPIGALSAWLFTVVHRQCLRLGRGIVWLTIGVDLADDQGLLAHLPRPDVRLDLARAIQSLPPHYRQVVLMRDVEELTINEIAHALDTTRESVKARLHRARTLLREYLG